MQLIDSSDQMGRRPKIDPKVQDVEGSLYTYSCIIALQIESVFPQRLYTNRMNRTSQWNWFVAVATRQNRIACTNSLVRTTKTKMVCFLRKFNLKTNKYYLNTQRQCIHIHSHFIPVKEIIVPLLQTWKDSVFGSIRGGSFHLGACLESSTRPTCAHL